MIGKNISTPIPDLSHGTYFLMLLAQKKATDVVTGVSSYLDWVTEGAPAVVASFYISKVFRKGKW